MSWFVEFYLLYIRSRYRLCNYKPTPDLILNSINFQEGRVCPAARPAICGGGKWIRRPLVRHRCGGARNAGNTEGGRGRGGERGAIRRKLSHLKETFVFRTFLDHLLLVNPMGHWKSTLVHNAGTLGKIPANIGVTFELIHVIIDTLKERYARGRLGIYLSVTRGNSQQPKTEQAGSIWKFPPVSDPCYVSGESVTPSIYYYLHSLSRHYILYPNAF